MMRVLITGGNGFVNVALCERIAEQGIETKAAVLTGTSARTIYSSSWRNV